MFESSLYIALGGALGSVGRFWLVKLFTSWLGAGFPWGTIVVNITGCFIIGFFGVLSESDGRFPASPLMRQFVIVGICGGYTTFSAFSLQTLGMLEKGAWGEAMLHIAGSVILCLFAVWLGSISAGMLNPIKGP